jgi:hypothetical protein
MTETAMVELRHDILEQRRRIRNRMLPSSVQRWPLDTHDETELKAIDALLVRIDAALSDNQKQES